MMADSDLVVIKDLLKAIKAQLNRIELELASQGKGLALVKANLTRVLIQEEVILADLSDLEAEVERNTSVDGSVVALLESIVAQLEAAKTDPVKIQALVDKLKADNDKLAAAVAANTPAAPQT